MAKRLLEFIKKHKLFSMAVITLIALLIVPLIYTKMNAADDEIKLPLRTPGVENSYDNPYIIDSVDDFIILQEYSKTNDCFGMYFAVGDTLKNNRLTYNPEAEDEEDEEGSEANGITYNLNLVGTIILEDGLTKAEFRGIGQNKTKPFRGNILFNGITIRLDTPLFGFIASGATIDEVHLFGDVTADKLNIITSKNASIGMLAGMATLDSTEFPLNISNVSVSHNSTIVGSGKSVGGIIGMVYATASGNKNYQYDSTIPATTVNANKDVFVINFNTVTIPDDAKIYTAGKWGNNFNYQNCVNNAGMVTDSTPGYTGGIVGDIVSNNNGLYIDVNFTSLKKDPQTGITSESGGILITGMLSNDYSATGGVIGHIGAKVRVKLDCDVDTSEVEQIVGYSVYKGLVIGSTSRYSVVYMTENHEVIRPTNGDLDVINEVEGESTGTATTIYKNTEEDFWSEGIKIAGDGSSANPYILADVEDVEILSVLLTTGGRYGAYYNTATNEFDSWFNVPEDLSGGTMSYTDIVNYVRRANFKITADIDLSEKNILRLNRETDVSFAGSIIGETGSYKDGNIYPTLTINTTEYQSNIALIPYATGKVVNGVPMACEYKNFNIEGTLEGRGGVFGLIYILDQRSNHGILQYSDYIFENINMNLDMNQKLANSSNMSGFIGEAKYQGVIADLNEGLKLTFKNISYKGDMITNSTGNSYGGAIVGAITVPANDMNNPEEINNLVITVDGYEFSGNISNVSNNTFKVSAGINQITASNSSYKSYYIGGRSVNIGKSAILNVSNVDIYDTVVTNGGGAPEMSGVFGYSYTWVDSYFKNVNFDNVDFDVVGGYGAFFITSNGSYMEIDGLTYNDVSIIRRQNASQWLSTLFWTNTGVVAIKDYEVSNSNIKLNASKKEISENAYLYKSTNTTQKVDISGVFSYEGNRPDGKKYSTINYYESPWVYTDVETGTKDYKSTAQHIGTRTWYNVFSNMEGKHISGTGTKDDPFIIDSEEKMVFISQVFSRLSINGSMDYFSDIYEMFTSEEMNSLPFTEKEAKITHRVLTGVYVFAKDMDVSEYSFYPINGIMGEFYGFDAYEYSGKSTLTDEELKTYCSTAIAVLNSGNTVNGITLNTVNSYKPDIHFRADRVGGANITTGGTEKTPEQSPEASGDGWYKSGSSYGIHTEIQSGLFSGITGGVSAGGYTRGENIIINNIMLSGVVSKYNVDNNFNRGNGAFLITGNGTYPAIYVATVNISNIDFSEAFIMQRIRTTVNNNANNCGSGLLVDGISSGKVNITGIKILRDINGTANVRADALIGYQNGSSSRVIFRDIDLNAVIDEGKINKTTQNVDGTDVEVVSIITSEAEGSWRSDNTSVSDKDSVTGKYIDPYDEYGYGFKYGYFYYHLKEGAAIYYYETDVDVVTPGKIDNNVVPKRATIPNKILLNSVQKYAYKVVNVDVNPINSNITQGSGTENDPYIIDSVGQLIALANFIKYEGDIISYEDWWVGDIDGTGYDELDPLTWSDNANVLYANRYVDDTNDKRIQAVKHLASSYYKITVDIDFTDPRSPYADLATNFNGIGTEKYPFSGAFIGEPKGDGSNPIIYIGNSVDSYQKTYGLIQYGKGFEVANLNFENGWAYLENIDEYTGEYTYTQTTDRNRLLISSSDTTAGIVAAYVVGGDNIIRNVNLDCAVQLENNGNTSLKLGGYVGFMRAGSLKVTGINEETFDDFQIGIKENMTMPVYSATYNQHVSALVGDVDGGYILYDDETDTISSDIVRIDATRVPLTDSNGNVYCEVPDMKYYNKYGVALCNVSNPVNQAYLDNILETVGRIEIKYNGTDSLDAATNENGMLIANLENEDHVFLYSLALSSGALSAVDSVGYYNNLASCKKDESEWNDWLNNENANKSAGEQITLSDAWNFPAIFKYFDFTALDDSYLSVYYSNSSMLNMANTGLQNGIRRTNWTLTGPDVYDMSKFGNEFTGIGISDTTGYNTSVDWPQVRFLTMCANFDGNGRTINVAIERANTAALFTYLSTENNNNTPYVIKNFTLTGSVTQTTEGTTNNSYMRAAGVAGYIRHGWYNFDGITLSDITITNLHGGNAATTAGVVASTENSTAKFYNIAFSDNVVITSPNGTGGVAGGLIGIATRITAENININNTTISTGAAVGGVIGRVNNQHGASFFDKITVTNSTFETRSNSSNGSIVGEMFGNNNNNKISMHDVTVIDNSQIAPDGADKVGRIVGAHTGANYYQKEILKIYDKYTDNYVGPVTDKVLNCYVTSEYEDCDYFYYNNFSELEQAEELYDIKREDAEGNVIVRYADCIETDLFMAPDADNDGVLEQLDLIPSTPEMDNTIIRWSSDSGTLENVLNSVISTLTNGTGLLNEDTNNNNISITVESLQINNGVISSRPAGEETIFITEREGKYVVSNNNKYDTIERDDSKTGVHVPGTFSLVHVTYSVGGGAYEETITIPVFVSNMVNVDIYSKLMIGEEYNVDVLRAIKRTASDIQVTTKNSTFTVYTEFLYSANRIDFDEELYMNKGFRLYDAPDPYVALGTKLTLIDLTFEDEPKVYYYEVNSADTFIPLTWFKDENGVAYKERNLNILDKELNGLPITRSHTTMYVNQRNYKKTDRGIEKYLLIVDCSEVVQTGNETSFSPIIMDGVETGQDEIVNKEVFYTKYRTYNTLSTYNGRTVQFVDGSVVTDGEINKDKQLNVSVQFTDEATQFYWSNIKPYDFINQNKYLEVVAYLKNDAGEKIMLPTGTRIKSDASGVYEGVKNTSAIFYYKDVVDTGAYAMLDKTGNTTTTVSFSLDFTYAKMEKLPSGNYRICFDVVRNFNPDYPMGDDILDTIEGDVITVSASAEYGFRLDVHDKESLAFNLADVEKGTPSEINFDVLMNSTLPANLTANKQIDVKFILYKKDAESGLYIPYNNPNVAKEDINLTLSHEGNKVSKNLNTEDFAYSFTGIAGVDSEITSLDAVLSIPYEADICNYKLYSEMYVDGNKVASDFFIVNISNIAH